ncbi:beta-galactosidase trimerization domain-containing protein [Halalkalibaculum sp. DA3122]|uniref:beta-galactosidase trimerization domain-containing protein n=1 Tax=Halalkalibaculum sp. DA3122 TaxID=3373607 RepID=UPI003754F399
MNYRGFIRLLGSALILGLVTLPVYAQQGHDFMHDKYDQMHDSPMQQKFEKIAPVPAGVVYIQRPGEGEEEIREHFRTMKELGFTNLKQVMSLPGWSEEEIKLIALEEGIIPWWYAEGGWEPITDELIAELGLEDLTMKEIRRHPKMIEYQKGVMEKRIKRSMAYQDSTGRDAPNGSSSAFDPTVGGRGLDLSPEGEKLFVAWARERYGDIETLNHAYNQHHANLQARGGAFESWDDFANRWDQYNHREFRIRRDILRFKADYGMHNLQEQVDEFHELHPHAPYRAGGELGLFRPHAWFGVDFPGIADIMEDDGSFYPSIHFTWHFDQVNDELGPTVYMQASYINDMFKGGWSGGWETTGGPQQFGGEKFGQNNKGFTVDAPEMQQFTLSMLASGFKGWGLWSWSIRTAGAEVGEYALLDHQNNVTERAREVGKIAQGMQKYREELWAAHKEPLVGVFFDWDNEAMWTALSMKGQDSLRYRPMQARVGLTRGLINADIPFEYLNPDDLEAGLANRYPIIYLPGVIALNKDLLPIFTDYVEQGGRLVMDMPGAWTDTYSALFPRGTDSEFAELFGTVLREYHFSGINRDWYLNGEKLIGSIGSLNPREADIIARFDNGEPAVTEHQLGKGTAVILGYEAARLCFRPGNTKEEKLLRTFTMGDYTTPFHSDGAIVYRLASPDADHYFLLNEGEQRKVKLNFDYYEYDSASDVATGEAVALDGWIDLPGHGARWLRYEK